MVGIGGRKTVERKTVTTVTARPEEVTTLLMIVLNITKREARNMLNRAVDGGRVELDWSGNLVAKIEED